MLRFNRRQMAAAYRAEANQDKVLQLSDAIPVGSMKGGMLRECIEHNPFEVKRLAMKRKIVLDERATKYLNTVFRAKKKGRAW